MKDKLNPQRVKHPLERRLAIEIGSQTAYSVGQSSVIRGEKLATITGAWTCSFHMLLSGSSTTRIKDEAYCDFNLPPEQFFYWS